ncbi:hypothetical protein NC653_029436 [Populus alba x Populus x berolinensis]|uniref:Uncharacterized protein n=1 Tax=Populus alba x Populus x berolinensis TaxID=444605 RepID=A0AAD6Q579_9ROSI|nr:hypothetical protein NC653_029436 [Populus alba x Populus x berolinensis]
MVKGTIKEVGCFYGDRGNTEDCFRTEPQKIESRLAETTHKMKEL